MKIDYSRPYVKELDELLTGKSKTMIRDIALRSYGSFTDLTVGQWIRCSQGDYTCVIGDMTGSWLQVYWLKYFVDEAERFPETLEHLSPKMDANEQRACDVLMQSTLVESVLVFARNYFQIPSFSAVEQLTIGEILIAKKASYNEIMYNKRVAKIRAEQYKSK